MSDRGAHQGHLYEAIANTVGIFADHFEREHLRTVMTLRNQIFLGLSLIRCFSTCVAIFKAIEPVDDKICEKMYVA